MLFSYASNMTMVNLYVKLNAHPLNTDMNRKIHLLHLQDHTHHLCHVFPYRCRVLLLQHVYTQGAAKVEGASGPGAPVWLHHNAQLQQQTPSQGQ